jgi:hypothetical protein
MLFREIIALYSVSHTKQINMGLVQSFFLILRQVVHLVTIMFHSVKDLAIEAASPRVICL